MTKPQFPKLIITVVVILTIAGIGYVRLVVWRSDLGLKNLGESQISGSITDQEPRADGLTSDLLSSGETDTSSWQTYHNDGYRFELQHPKDWHLVLEEADFYYPLILSMTPYDNIWVNPPESEPYQKYWIKLMCLENHLQGNEYHLYEKLAKPREVLNKHGVLGMVSIGFPHNRNTSLIVIQTALPSTDVHCELIASDLKLSDTALGIFHSLTTTAISGG